MSGQSWFQEAPCPGLLVRGVAYAWNQASKFLDKENIQVRTTKDGVTVQWKGKPLEGHPHEDGILFWFPSSTDELEKLKEQDAFKSHFLNMAAHELNTPLTPIRLQHHLLVSEALGRLTEKQRGAHEILTRNLDRLGSLVSDILDVARLEGQALTIKRSPFDLVAAIQESIDSFREPANRVGVDLVLEARGPVPVVANKDRIAQVIDNLIANAVKFTKNGGRVVVSVQATEEATVSIRDSGIGMEKEQLAKLFQPFSQVHENQSGGTGLGLYICKGILEAHGQDIHVESPGEGRGTTCSFSLPRTEEAPMMAAPKKTNALADRLRELI